MGPVRRFEATVARAIWARGAISGWTRSLEWREFRSDAAQVWAAIEPIPSHHVEADDNGLLPWLPSEAGPGPSWEVLS